VLTAADHYEYIEIKDPGYLRAIKLLELLYLFPRRMAGNQKPRKYIYTRTVFFGV
jgi:hypothetical protein